MQVGFQDCASVSFCNNGFLFAMALAKYFFLKKNGTITEHQKKKSYIPSGGRGWTMSKEMDIHNFRWY